MINLSSLFSFQNINSNNNLYTGNSNSDFESQALLELFSGLTGNQQNSFNSFTNDSVDNTEIMKDISLISYLLNILNSNNSASSVLSETPTKKKTVNEWWNKTSSTDDGYYTSGKFSESSNDSFWDNINAISNKKKAAQSNNVLNSDLISIFNLLQSQF